MIPEDYYRWRIYNQKFESKSCILGGICVMIEGWLRVSLRVAKLSVGNEVSSRRWLES